jgi:hypothetical protein
MNIEKSLLDEVTKLKNRGIPAIKIHALLRRNGVQVPFILVQQAYNTKI